MAITIEEISTAINEAVATKAKQAEATEAVKVGALQKIRTMQTALFELAQSLERLSPTTATLPPGAEPVIITPETTVS